MPHKDPEKKKEYDKAYYQKHKEKKKEYYKTPHGKKSNTISKWRERGILFHDYDLLHDIYLSTTHCHFCNCLLNQCNKSRKCVDHDHDIHDNENVRGIICHVCNWRDVLNQN